MTETELVLALTERAARGLARLPQLAEAKPQRRSLRAIYFDTDTRDLWSRRIGLRIRREGGGWMQTAKWSGAGLLDREELNLPLAGRLATAVPPLDPSGLPPAALDRLDRLHAQFETVVQRNSWRIPFQASLIEVSLDRGHIRHRNGEVRQVCDVELELIEGQASSLWDLALRVMDAFPGEAWVEPRSKAERGMGLMLEPDERLDALTSAALGRGGPASPGRSAPALDSALRLALGEGFLQIARCMREADETAEPEGPHQLRVAVRRLRSILRMLRPFLESPDWQRTQDDLRWLATAAGDCRELDVLRLTLLEPIAARLPNDPALVEALQLTADAREIAHAALGQAVRSERAQRLLIGLGQAAQASLPALAAMDTRAFASAQLQVLRKKIRRREVHVAANPDSAEALHELRLAHKAMRYAASWLGEIGDRDEARRLRRRSAKAQELLGEAQDVATSVPRLAGLLQHAEPVVQARALALVEGWSLARSRGN